MFKIHCKRHYKKSSNIYVAGVQHDVNTSRKRRLRDAEMRSAAAARRRTALISEAVSTGGEHLKLW